MPKAAFSLKNYRFPKVTLDQENNISDSLQIGFEPKGIFNIDSKTYNLTFKTDVISGVDKEKPIVEIVCEAEYVFLEANDISSIPEFFYSNSIAILYPYIRAYISFLTTQANVPGIILPTLNLSNLGVVLKKNTIQK